MGIHPVTQAQWAAVLGTDPSRFKGLNRLVERVEWGDYRAFCRELMTRMKGWVQVRLPMAA